LYTKLDFEVTLSTGVRVALTLDIFSDLESALGMSINSKSNELWSVEESGAGYTMLQAPENVADLFYTPGFPTTYIVDRNGNVVGDAFVGVAVNDIEAKLMELTGN